MALPNLRIPPGRQCAPIIPLTPTSCIVSAMGLWQGTPWITIALTNGLLSSGDVLRGGVLAGRYHFPASLAAERGAACFL